MCDDLAAPNAAVPHLRRGLSNRHIQLIAIGGAIGTGLFMGSGRTISLAGPAVVVVYGIIGFFVFFVLRAMGELLLSNLNYKSFVDFSADLLGPAAGFFVGWSYWFAWIATGIAEVVAICLYFELAHPEPALMGVGKQDRAIVADWHHRIERQGFWAVGDAFRNSAPGLKGRALPGPDDYEQISALAVRGLARTARFFEMLDRRLAGRQFVASDRYTIADIMALVTVNFAARINLAVPEGCSHLRRWHEAVAARPSAAA